MCSSDLNRGHTPYLDEPPVLTALDAFLARLPGRVGVRARARRSLSALAFLARMKLAGVI